VIDIAVRDAHVIDAADAEGPEGRRDDTARDIEARRGESTGVDAQRAAVWKLHDGGIALAYIEKRDAEELSPGRQGADRRDDNPQTAGDGRKGSRAADQPCERGGNSRRKGWRDRNAE
jgi:hypothetical protein